MRSYASLRRAGEFARLRRQGRRAASEAITVFVGRAQSGDSLSGVGITVGKTVGKAVVRNAVRRRIGAILHETLKGHEPLRVLVVAQPQAATASFASLREQLQRVIVS